MKTMTRTTAEEVVLCLPQVAIDYLWNLTRLRPEATGHTFLLTKEQMNGQVIQDILHIAGDGGPSQCHKVYGFPAINGAIRVVDRGGEQYMALYGPLEALGTLDTPLQ